MGSIKQTGWVYSVCIWSFTLVFVAGLPQYSPSHTCKCCASLSAIQPVTQTDFYFTEHTWRAYVSQQTDGSWFSPFILRFPGIELRSTGLAASTFTH